jgi:hypothetical protein
MIDSAIDFMCQNDGDRIARKLLFFDREFLSPFFLIASFHLAFFLTASFHINWLTQPSLDITLRMIDSAIDFMCQNDGDRIARKFLF